MKPQQNLNGLGFTTPASQACAIEGCDPDFILFSSVVVPSGAELAAVLPTPFADLTAAFPGGLVRSAGARGLWFFQSGLPELLQSRQEYVQGGPLTTSSPTSGIAGQIAVESMQIHAVGLQIASTYGNTPAVPADIKKIADACQFDMWLDGGTSPERPEFSLYSDVALPVVTMPSNVGLYGSTAESASAIASLGVPGSMFMAELKQKPVLQKGQLIGARLSFPAMAVANGVTGVVSAANPNLAQSTLVRLFLFGKAIYKNRS